MSFKPKRPGTWLNIIAAWQTVKYQNSLPTCFYVINDLAIWIRVCHVRSTNTFEDWSPAGTAIILEPFKRIHRRAFPPINFLSKSDWNCWGKRPASDLVFSSAEVVDMDDSDAIPYIQKYLL